MDKMMHANEQERKRRELIIDRHFDSLLCLYPPKSSAYANLVITRDYIKRDLGLSPQAQSLTKETSDDS